MAILQHCMNLKIMNTKKLEIENLSTMEVLTEYALQGVIGGAVTSRGDHWSWRNWVVSRVRREGNQILWQLENIEAVD